MIIYLVKGIYHYSGEEIIAAYYDVEDAESHKKAVEKYMLDHENWYREIHKEKEDYRRLYPDENFPKEWEEAWLARQPDGKYPPDECVVSSIEVRECYPTP